MTPDRRRQLLAATPLGSWVLGGTARFNEDEPRDDHGRWTSGGSSSEGTAIGPAPPPVTKKVQPGDKVGNLQVLTGDQTTALDTSWFSGRPKGLPQIGLHGSIWGSADRDSAEGYATDDGVMRVFKITPQTKIIHSQDKLDLARNLFGWTEDQYGDAVLNDGTLRDYYAKVLGNIGQKATGNFGEDVTTFDTAITKRMQEYGLDAAVMWDGDNEASEIVIANPHAIENDTGHEGATPFDHLKKPGA
jgi:hypothetical protein